MKKIIFVLSLLLVIGTFEISAQTKTVKGKVVAFKAYPVNFVSISAKKNKTKAITDSLGYFTIECHKKDKLVFDAAGFQNAVIKLEDQDSLKVNLIAINNQNAFKDVVRERHMTQSDLDYCVNNLLDDNNNFDQMLTIYEIIQFLHPTARIVSERTTEDGAGFGSTGNQIILDSRGPRSILASPLALLVVDGIATRDISGIEPKQVKNIKILTGSNAGHWGTRGANGVVEITLKYQ